MAFDGLQKNIKVSLEPEVVKGHTEFEKITPEEIRRRMEDPADPIQNLIVGMIKHFCHGKYQNDIDDLAQITKMRILRGSEGFDGRSSFNSWAYKIALNVFRDYLRKGKRRMGDINFLDEIVETDESNSGLESNLSPTETEIISKLDNQAFWNSLRGDISLDEVKLLKMKLKDELTFQAIANLSNEPLSNIKTRYYDLREKIRKIKGTEKKTSKNDSTN